MPPSKNSFYAVRVGRTPGIYTTWAAAKDQVHRFPSAVFKGFASRAEAAAFVGGGASSRGPLPRQASSRPAPPWEEEDRPEGGPGDEAGPSQPPPPAKKARRAPPTTKPAAAGGDGGADAPPPSSPLLDPAATYRLEFDGASRGNHVAGGGGSGGCGAVLYLEAAAGAPPAPDAASASLKEVGRLCVAVGAATNNVAEWAALEMGLEVRNGRETERWMDMDGESRGTGVISFPSLPSPLPRPRSRAARPGSAPAATPL